MRELFEEFKRLTPEERERRRQEHIERKAARLERYEREHAQRMREHQVQQLRQRWLWMAGPYAEATFASFQLHGDDDDQREQSRIIQELKDLDIDQEFQNGTNLLFIGPCGTGKDHLLFSLMRSIYQSHGVTYLNGADFRLKAREARRDGNGSEESLIDSLSKAELLCLSDPSPAGGASLSESQADVLYHVIERRCFKQRPTWATINLPAGSDLRETAIRIFTAQVWDRLKHRSIIVPCRWESYRKPERVL